MGSNNVEILREALRYLTRRLLDSSVVTLVELAPRATLQLALYSLFQMTAGWQEMIESEHAPRMPTSQYGRAARVRVSVGEELQLAVERITNDNRCPETKLYIDIDRKSVV